MTTDDIINSIENTLKEHFSDKITISSPQNDIVRVDVDRENLIDLVNFTKDELDYIRPLNGTSVDREEYFEMYYHFGTLNHPVILEVLIKLERENPTLPSLTPMWLGFDWHEREAYDLMGIVFENHPDLRRIF
ncbi:MAG: NADH-quinone oxidoreductase subunit C, partial [Candidatus Heimdallarchaeota archaeon]|nr:NADH-quinone oxidoreductase subunit C [Candidatus Heimdallarchaeota archaeon]MCK5049824.1 NADH-quinone oxidoreductase subunit C [Candidatus Heimdallarchaeota archaeon]